MMTTAKKSAPKKKAPASKDAESLKTLVIAEKPSVAADFAKVLKDKFKKEKTHYEGEKWVISYAVGHLLTISDPREMDERYKSWDMKNLPIIPDHFPLKPLSGTKSQLSALAKLIRRKDIGTIINACDAGREGELIFRYIMQHVEAKRLVKKEKQRLWLQSMTPAAIRDAFGQLRTNEEMENLQNAALSRGEADWLVGINATRSLTAYNSQFGGFHKTPCGRVQTPTLSLIVKREEERNDFTARPYWTLEGEFECSPAQYIGKWFNPEFSKDPENPNLKAERIWTEAQALEIQKKCQGKTGQVEEQTKPSTQKCAALYDLTTLQREANSRFGYSAKRTLQIAQALYERYKATTYPRTDSRALPEDYLGQVEQTMQALQKTPQGKFAKQALENGYIKPDKKIFNNAKISDHHAIIPTGTIVKELPEPEQKIFTMIVQRFIGVFFPTARFLNTSRITRVEGESFKTEGKVLVEPGWKAIYGSDKDDGTILQALTQDEAFAKEITPNREETKPPARYTESSLLSIMESAGKLVDDDSLRDALKERGLGTPATRAAIIEKLIQDKYLFREGRELVPSSKAFDLIRLSTAMDIEALTSPEMTGEWEHKLGLMEKGKYTRDDFMGEIAAMARHIVDRAKGFDESKTRKEASFSPVNGTKIWETVSRYETDEGIQIRKTLGGRQMAPEEVQTLLEKRKLGPMSGFRSKKGASFTAVIILNDKNKVEFVFEDDTAAPDGEELDLSTQKPLGNSPVDNSPVYETLTGYVSKSALDKEKTGLRISKTILGAVITPENMVRMLNGEKTELIKGFKSSRTRRLFDAFLKLSAKGKVEFDFPPRKFGPRKKGAKKSEE
jgi:DNA topoisomerase-3